jgi:hypothetical protein
LTNRIHAFNKDGKSENSAVDLLSYLNNQNQKEIKQKENVRIKLCKKSNKYYKLCKVKI